MTEARIDRVLCPDQVRVRGKPVDVAEILSIDARFVRADPLGNGIAVGALAGGFVGGLAGPIMFYQDMPSVAAVLIGVIPGGAFWVQSLAP